jgi:tRNA1Val (adenine37-N6)-methyltransferase
MSVKVKMWKGAWWIFIDHYGRRKAKRVGTGKEGHRAEHLAAEKIQARLVLGDFSLLEEPRPWEITLHEYGHQWLATDVALRLKPATAEKYAAILRKHWLLELGKLPLSGISRDKVKAILQGKLMEGIAQPGRLGHCGCSKVDACNYMNNQENHNITLDRLAGSWRIFQLRRGHRFSTDDLLTAWAAVRAQPKARRLLDLGAGIGSVGLLALWKLPPGGDLTMVEVQAVSHALARHTVAYNGLAARVTLHLMDLRRWPGGTFDLVMASPPYLPLARGVCPQHAQKASARFELHGDIFDFCSAAACSLADTGVFCFSQAADDPRPEQAIATSGLTLVHRQRVYFRATVRPRMALFTCAWRGTREDPPPLVIRDQEGRWTAEYLSIREEMGASAAFLQRARRPP